MPKMAARSTTKTDDKVEETPAEETPDKGNITVKDLCTELDADPKAFRRWLRTQTTDRAGRGGRWTFSPEVAAELKERYTNRSSNGGTEPSLDEVDAD